MRAKRVKIGVPGTVVLLAVACVYAQGRPPVKGAARTSFPVDTTVAIDAGARTVRPLIALLPPGATIDLAVAGLAPGQTLEVDFRVQRGVKGPFARSQRMRGRYTFAANGKAAAGPVDQGGEEAWKYEIVVREKDDTDDVWAVDPMIVTKE
ncbi:MAG TPA: hypothetical protein VLI67_01590 [Vicinamibacteria bacterium]|nr:hypothetical protein [Vicinamibacteria bacterium]